MQIRVRELCGVGGVPTCRKNAGNWLTRRSIAMSFVASNGGPCAVVNLSDLPEDVRLAYLRRTIADLHLNAGTYDDDAHSELAKAAPSRRARAEQKAAIARTLVALIRKGTAKSEAHHLVRE